MKSHGKHKHESEELVDVSVRMEEEQVELLEELAAEYRERLGPEWDLSAMVRVAVGDFLTKMGRMS